MKPVTVQEVINALTNPPGWISAGELAERIRTPGIAPPDGYAIVPIEPTDDMAHAAVQHIDEDPHYYYKWNTAKDVYKAMLTAAPKGELE